MALYELALLGAPSDVQVEEVSRHVAQAVEPFGLRLGEEIGWSVRPERFEPPQDTAAAAAYFGADGVVDRALDATLRRGIPVLPVVSAVTRATQELPESLRALNALAYTETAVRVTTALLECVGLLPRQRRIFLSYRRTESRAAALQLFDELSARQFEVFVDTHGVPPAEDFQAVLWQRLCDADVLLMLDTPGYFDSLWTDKEFGRALAKKIPVLRVGWPGFPPLPRCGLATSLDLEPVDLDSATGRLSDGVIRRICAQLEALRSRGHAVRHQQLFSHVQQAMELLGGSITGVGARHAMHLRIPRGRGERQAIVYSTVGVPTAVTLYEVLKQSESGRSLALVYDETGVERSWLDHLDWLGHYIHEGRWVKATEAAWNFSDWEE
jgi:hypothetical protein